MILYIRLCRETQKRAFPGPQSLGNAKNTNTEDSGYHGLCIFFISLTKIQFRLCIKTYITYI